MRLTFHVEAPVQTSSRRLSSLATHTGVETSDPSRLRVVRLMYRVWASSASEVYIVYFRGVKAHTGRRPRRGARPWGHARLRRRDDPRRRRPPGRDADGSLPA